jgi:archaellum component FlaC
MMIQFMYQEDERECTSVEKRETHLQREINTLNKSVESVKMLVSRLHSSLAPVLREELQCKSGESDVDECLVETAQRIRNARYTSDSVIKELQSILDRLEV